MPFLFYPLRPKTGLEVEMSTERSNKSRKLAGSAQTSEDLAMTLRLQSVASPLASHTGEDTAGSSARPAGVICIDIDSDEENQVAAEVEQTSPLTGMAAATAGAQASFPKAALASL